MHNDPSAEFYNRKLIAKAEQELKPKLVPNQHNRSQWLEPVTDLLTFNKGWTTLTGGLEGQRYKWLEWGLAFPLS